MWKFPRALIIPWVGCQKLDTGASPGGLMQGGGGLMQGVVTSEHYN